MMRDHPQRDESQHRSDQTQAGPDPDSGGRFVAKRSRMVVGSEISEGQDDDRGDPSSKVEHRLETDQLPVPLALGWNHPSLEPTDWDDAPAETPRPLSPRGHRGGSDVGCDLLGGA